MEQNKKQTTRSESVSHNGRTENDTNRPVTATGIVARFRAMLTNFFGPKTYKEPKAYIVPSSFYFALLTCTLLFVLETGLVLFYLRNQGKTDSFDEPKQVCFKKACTVDASCVLIKGTGREYRLVPVEEVVNKAQ
jgi:hypothetical protein